jgi:putative endonuclease
MSVGGRVGYDHLDMAKARDLISRAVALIARLRTELPLGRRGERAAEKYLKRNGYRIVARNFRASGAEIDLVAIDGETLVFVEVKTRRSRDAGAPEDAVDERKQMRMRRAAEAFSIQYRVGERDLRFDIVAVDAAGKHLGIELLRNAF